jgi:hypothetical protein
LRWKCLLHVVSREYLGLTIMIVFVTEMGEAIAHQPQVVYMSQLMFHKAVIKFFKELDLIKIYGTLKLRFQH